MRRTKTKGVSIISEGVTLPLPKAEIKRTAGKILSLLKERDSKIALVFVSDQRIRKLNRKYRRADRATDCLAFPMREGIDKRLNPQLLGDVVISVDAAKRNARLFGTSVKTEIKLYIIHGILHLLGFKDTALAGRKKMEGIQEDILRRL